MDNGGPVASSGPMERMEAEADCLLTDSRDLLAYVCDRVSLMVGEEQPCEKGKVVEEDCEQGSVHKATRSISDARGFLRDIRIQFERL